MTPKDTALKELYFRWLVKQVSDKDTPSYTELLRILHGVPFIWHLVGDDNREADGIDLREEFIGDTHQYTLDSVECLQEQCSVLEMLVALAMRMETLLEGDDDCSRMHIWFWDMIENLGFTDYVNDTYGHRWDDVCIFRVIDGFMDRSGVSSDGDGGLFPLKYPDCDQSEVEIWFQMQAYIMENYVEI
ncbi:MAG: hypothetical protein HUJ62_05560 [Streptococcus gallolyticus]|nr:hypothetical protein [Streptococcus gallolyticus]